MAADKAQEGMIRGGPLALAGCIFANIVDGYDVLSIAFAGSAIMEDWGISPAVLGTIFSAGLAGMMLGSLFISPLADRFGRRRISLVCMAMMTVGMFCAAASNGPGQLIAARLLTGLGIGGVLAALNTAVAEMARPDRRNIILSIFSAGYPMGSIFGGLIAIWLIGDFGWRVVFLAGGALTGLVFLINLFTLPESSGSTGRMQLFSKQFLGKLFGPERRSITIAFCVAFFLHMMVFFFVLNWTPRLVEQLGFSAQTGNGVTVVLNVGSLLGPLLFGWLADRVGLFQMARAFFAIFAVSVVLLGLAPAILPLLYLAALLVGLAMAGAMTSLYAAAPVIFPGPVRAAGTGLAIGLGRLGGTLGPSLAGFAIAAGLGRIPLHLVFAVPVAVVFLIIASKVFRAEDLALRERKELQ